MTTIPIVAALGIVDRERIAGSSGIWRSWSSLGVPAPGNGRTFRAVFGRSDETFRRLDRLSRAVVLAGEAAGIGTVVPAAWRDDTALVFETTVGCLDSDLRFARSLRAEMCDAPIFPYTLPSTCLGELALRHGLRGPSICLSTTPSACGAALREAAHLLASGAAKCVVAGLVDVLLDEHPSVAPVCRALIAVLAAPDAGLHATAQWAGSGTDAWSALQSWLEREPPLN